MEKILIALVLLFSLLSLFFGDCLIPTSSPSKWSSVQIDVLSGRKYFDCRSDTEITEHFLVTVNTTEDGVGKDVLIPREYLIVLDVSGSMAGDKIEAAKRAILGIVEKMSDEDYIHLVTFSCDSRIVFMDMQKEDELEIGEIVERLSPQGSTDLFSSLEKAETILDISKNFDRRSTMKRLFLLSDGEVNHGITDEKIILEKINKLQVEYHCSTSAFGVGTHFNEKLMKSVAEFGGGNYFFISEERGMIEKVLGIAVGAVRDLIGSSANLKFVPAKGVQVIKVFGYDLENGHISVGDVRKNNLIKFLVDVIIDPDFFLSESTHILQVDLDYLEQLSNTRVSFHAEYSILLTEDQELLEQRNLVVDALHKLQNLHEENYEKAEESILIEDYEQTSETYGVMTNEIEKLEEEFEGIRLALGSAEGDGTDTEIQILEDIQKENAVLKNRNQKLKETVESVKQYGGSERKEKLSRMQSQTSELSKKRSEHYDNL